MSGEITVLNVNQAECLRSRTSDREVAGSNPGLGTVGEITVLSVRPQEM